MSLRERPGAHLRVLIDAHLSENGLTISRFAAAVWPDMSGGAAERKLRRVLPKRSGPPGAWPQPEVVEAICGVLGVDDPGTIYLA